MSAPFTIQTYGIDSPKTIEREDFYDLLLAKQYLEKEKERLKSLELEISVIELLNNDQIIERILA